MNSQRRMRAGRRGARAKADRCRRARATVRGSEADRHRARDPASAAPPLPARGSFRALSPESRAPWASARGARRRTPSEGPALRRGPKSENLLLRVGLGVGAAGARAASGLTRRRLLAGRLLGVGLGGGGGGGSGRRRGGCRV